MDNNKLSSELNLALSLPEREREKSIDLNVGYSSVYEEWELILRYTGDLTRMQQELGIVVEELTGGYGIARVPQILIGKLSEYPQIDFIEKPKDLLIEQQSAIEKCCLKPVQENVFSLYGKGVLVACIDSGVDIDHELFRTAEGTSKISVFWDQTIPGNPPKGFTQGSVFKQQDLNRLIDQRKKQQGTDWIRPFDGSGHGTAVLGIIAQMAPMAEYIVVKMGNAQKRGFPRTTQFMTALDFSLRYAIQKERPLVVNISYGNNYGAHDGSALLERFIDNVSNQYKNVIVAGTGNDGLTGRHFYWEGEFVDELRVPIYASDALLSFHLQIWKLQTEDLEIYIETPDGRRVGPISSYLEIAEFSFERDKIAAWYGSVTPYNSKNEIYIAWIPKNQFVTPGIWNVVVKSKGRRKTWVEMWLPVSGSTSAEVFFVKANRENTLVVPASAREVVSVAAYDSHKDTFAAFSGQGMNREDKVRMKPNIAAPGVDVISAINGGGYGRFTGTSYAAPFVSGAAALLMEWGIVNGKDPYLFGEKVRVWLEQGARKLPFQDTVPSREVGWGALCVADSISPSS